MDHVLFCHLFREANSVVDLSRNLEGIEFLGVVVGAICNFVFVFVFVLCSFCVGVYLL